MAGGGGTDITDYSVREIVLADERFVLYRARDPDGNEVMLKVAREGATPDELSALSSDFVMAGRCNIPAIPRPIRIDTMLSGGTFQVRQHVPGQPLTLWLDGNQPRPSFSASIQIALLVIRALEPLHRRGFVHCDVSPRNLLYDPEGRAISFADCAWTQGSGMPSRRRTGGPTAYLAPEQLLDHPHEIDARADLFAVGVILYQLLAAELPPDEGFFTTQATNMPPGLATILARLLSPDRERRYLAATAAGKDLSRCLDDWRGQGALPEPGPSVDEQVETVRFPNQPLGRHGARAALAESLLEAGAGNPTLVLLLGEGGSGKSTVLADLRRGAHENDALVLGGDWGPFDGNIPFRGFALVCEQLIEWLSTLDDATRRRHIDEVREALGEGCGVITEAFPILESVLGIYPRPAPVGTIERQNRFTYCFTTLLATLGQPGRPLVLLLEDLHWADGASLMLIERLPGRGAPCHLLTVATVRTGPDGAAPSLVSEVEAGGEERGQTVRTLHVTPFELPDTESFLASALGMAPEATTALAEILTDMSLGNPLALRELLAELAAQGLLAFDRATGRWVWQTDAIRRSYVPEDVARIFASRISSLPEQAIAALRAAACIGARFDGEAVARLVGKTTADVSADLKACAGAGFIVARTTGAGEVVPLPTQAFEFRHERIRSAAYAGLSPETQERFHAAHGAAVLAVYQGTGGADTLFEALVHLNRSYELRQSRDDLALARLNLKGAVLAKEATAYQTAAQLLRNMEQQLPPEVWLWDANLAFESTLLRAECEHLSKRTELAEQTYNNLLTRLTDPERRITVLMARTQMLTNVGRFADSIADGVASLGLLGLELPANPKRAQVILPMLRILSLHRKLPASASGVSIADLDPLTSRTMGCLAELWGPAFWVSESLTGLVVFAMVRLSLTRGNCAASSIGYSSYGVFLATAFKKHRLGKEICRLGVVVAEKAGVPFYIGRARFMYEAFFGAYDQPLRTAPTTFRQIASGCLRAGDYSYAGAAANMFLYYVAVAGTPLSDFPVQARDIIGVALQTEQSRTLLTVEILTRWISILDCRAEYGAPRFADDLTGPKRRGSENEEGVFHLFEISLLYFLEDYRAADPHIAFMPGNKMLGGYFAGYYAFFAALILAKQAESRQDRKDRKWLARFRTHLRVLEKEAALAPRNYRHKVLLLRAIVADWKAAPAQATALFEEAITSAREEGFLPNAAIAAELYGEHLHRQRQEALAERQLRNARLWYHQWGCVRKVESIDRRLAKPATGERPASSPGGGGAETEIAWPRNAGPVLEATRALSGETDPARLAERLLSSLLEHTRATRVVLLTREDDKLTVACERRAHPVPAGAAEEPADKALPEAVVNYVDRLGRAVRLTANAEHELFGRDPYMKARPGVAILCVPLVSMRQKLGVLFLEKEAPGTLQQGDLVTAEILAAQAAATLRNAREYNERLTALQNQMHPHFLFNALSGIAELTVADPPRAEQAVLGLAGLYRNVLATSRQRAIPLKQELALVESYLALEKLRFGDRLSYQIETRGDPATVLIPPLVLQPLVENSVNHGIALKPEGGTVRVTVMITEHRVHARVSDDGAGWNAGGSGQGAGVGLISLRRRLQLFFGSEAELVLNTTAGVTVDMYVPVRTNEL